MCTYADLVNHIAGERVNDELDGADYFVWDRSVIRKVLREAIASILAFRPDLFARTKEVTLQRGSCMQHFCTECSRVLSVLTVDGCECQPVKPVKDVDTKTLDWLACYYDSCGTPINACCPESYHPGEVALIEADPCAVRLQYPPPLDRDVVATISCVPANALDAEPLPSIICSELFQAIVDNALFRLYTIDHKDGVARELADRHWAAFVLVMKTKFEVDFSLLSSNYVLTHRKGRF